MLVSVLRYPVTGTRADQEVYDEFEIDPVETPGAVDNLVSALRVIHSKQWWYWAEPKKPETNRGAFYDPTLRKPNEDPESEFSPLLSALLAGSTPTNF